MQALFQWRPLRPFGRVCVRQRCNPPGDKAGHFCQVPSDSVHHAGATCELVGPGRFTAPELGAVIERAVDKPIQVQEISADTCLNRWFGDADPSMQLRLT